MHESYSSFCLLVEEEDEKTVLSAQFWAVGTVIKPFFGRIFNERIHSKFDGQPNDSPVKNPLPSIVVEPVRATPEQAELMNI